MPKKKKFIDKKNAVTFHLVHRSQKDPLQADEDAPKHVLLPNVEAVEKRREEQAKFGVFFDDDYDYLQHLRNVDEINKVEPIEERFRVEAKRNPLKRKNEPEITIKDDETSKSDGRIILPSTVFASEMETEVGLLNKAAPLRGPQPDWDPDIVAALDDDFDFENDENILDDDFILKANEEREDDVDNVGGYEDYASDEADFSDDDLGSLDGPRSFDSEETKTRFTNYSVTSSVIRRNEGLALLDDRFEKLFEQYDDEEIGALESEDIDGTICQNSAVLNNVMEEFEEKRRQTKMKDAVEKGEEVGVRSESDDSDEELEKMVVREPTEKWDCESILSTYSTLYNHPKTIIEPKKIRLDKSGIPCGVLNRKHVADGLTLKQIEKEFNSARSNEAADRAPTYRGRDETPEERRERKQAVKEERRDRRVEKKATKDAFKKEKIRQDKELINLQANLKGVKMT